MSTLFIIANVTITVGYYVLAGALTKLLRRFVAINTLTRVGMSGFFITCSLTHLHMAYHAAFSPDAPFSDHFFEPFSLLNHTLQAIFVWTFVAGMAKALEQGRLSTDPVEQARKVVREDDSRD